MRGAVILTRLFGRYFVRKILAVGPMRNPLVRFVLGIAVLVLLGAMTIGSALFLRSAGVTSQGLWLILQVASVSLFFWVLILVVFGRVLFLRSGSFLTFTLHLPVTNRQRTAAMAMFEALGVLGLGFLLVMPLMLACCWVLGLGSVPALLIGLLFPVVIFFLVFSAAHNLLEALLAVSGLGRVARVVTIVLFSVGAAAFNTRMPALISAISGDYLRGVSRLHGLDFFAYLDRRMGPWVTTGVFLAASVPLAVVLVWSTPGRPPLSRQFVRLGRPPRSALALYLIATARRVESLTVVVLAYAVAAIMACSSGNYVVCVGMFAVSGLYAHASTTTLRSLPARRWAPASEFALLFFSQVCFALACAAPLLAAVTVTDGLLTATIGVGVLISGCLFTVFLGIEFMPERDNPLAVFLCLAVCVGSAGCAAAVIGVLAMPMPAIVASIIALHLVTIGFGISGMQSLERKVRHVHS